MINPYDKDPKLKGRTTCIQCSVVFNNISYRSKKGSRGMCKPCYMRWLWDNGYRVCKSCNCALTSPQAVPYCRLCKKEMRDGLVEIPNIKGISKRKKKETPFNPLDVLTRWDIMDIKMLLLRFKIGSNTAIDHFRVIHYYTKIWDTDIKLDVYEPDAQVHYMLKRLKHFYESNTNLKPRGWS